MKISELKRRLKEAGWNFHREGKKHELWRHDNFDYSIAIPRHQSKELAKGTEESILKQAGLK